MGRLMSIDFGQKRVGIAVTDPLQIIANGLDTIPSAKIWDFLNEYLTKEQIDCFIVGYPKKLNNEDSESIKFIDPFIKKLKKTYPSIKVELFDERFTSKIAFQTMIDGGLKKKQRQNKALIDKISATIILQNYLDSIRR